MTVNDEPDGDTLTIQFVDGPMEGIFIETTSTQPRPHTIDVPEGYPDVTAPKLRKGHLMYRYIVDCDLCLATYDQAYPAGSPPVVVPVAEIVLSPATDPRAPASWVARVKINGVFVGLTFDDNPDATIMAARSAIERQVGLEAARRATVRPAGKPPPWDNNEQHGGFPPL